MATSTTLKQQYYAIVFKVPQYKLDTEDVLNLYYCRMPIQRIATLCYLTAAISQDIFNLIHADIEKNILPKCTIEIWTVDINKSEGATKTKKKRLILKNYIINKLVLQPEFDTSKWQNSQVFISQFMLMNEVIYALEKSQRYNSSYHDITAYDVIQKFYNRIASEFEDGVEYKEYGVQKYINKFKYETVTSQGYSDLILPFYILKNYKALMTHSYYFFDDFYYSSDDNKNDIVVFFNTLTNDQQYKKINIHENPYYEFQKSLQILKKEPVIDQFNFFENASKVVNFYGEVFDGNIEFKRGTNSIVPNLKKQTAASTSSSNANTRFTLKKNYSLKDQTREKANSLLSLYAPDNLDNAKLRFTNYSDLVRNKFAAVWTCMSNNCFLDVVQFNKIYNLDVNDVGNYNFLPIAILNRFSREENNHKYLRSTTKFQVLRFTN